MPTLERETDQFPHNLLEWENLGLEGSRRWWALYTLSRKEKELARRLVGLEVPFYAPLFAKRVPSPQGRVRTSWLPIFSNYVFVYGTNEQRVSALTTNCVSRCLDVSHGSELTQQLRRVRNLISAGKPITFEERLEAGAYVRIKRGAFEGCEGEVVKRRGRWRLLVSVQLIQRTISVELDDFSVESAAPRDPKLELRSDA